MTTNLHEPRQTPPTPHNVGVPVDFLKIRKGLNGMRKNIMLVLSYLKSLIIPISVILALSLMIVVPMFVNPLRRPQANVRNYILRLTPLGTSIEDVIETIESRRGWEVRYINFEGGYLHPGPRIPGWPTAQSGASIIGEQSVRIYRNYRAFYKLFLSAAVNIYWGFDADGRLIEVHVNKFIEI